METTLPPILETKLADFRRRVWVVKLAEGVLGAIFGIALLICSSSFSTASSRRPAGSAWAFC